MPMPQDKRDDEIASRHATAVDELGLLIDGATNYAIYMLDPEGRVVDFGRRPA